MRVAACTNDLYTPTIGAGDSNAIGCKECNLLQCDTMQCDTSDVMRLDSRNFNLSLLSRETFRLASAFPNLC